MSELVRCEKLTKIYDRTVALDHIDLTVENGKIVGLLGPNGSGKTTLIKLLTGLLTPDEGAVLVDGNAPGPETKKVVAYLPDRNFLNTYMKVGEIVQYFEDFYEDFKPERAYRMLEELGIEKDVQLKTLSKGNKEKVALILTMSRDAKLYVLDEPIAGVDPATRDYIIRTIISNYQPEASVLISTHLISDVESVLDEVIFIQNGTILLQKTVDEIREEKGMSVDAMFREVFRW
ncbi:MAG: ABC transporter ATP-binding protein [Lachnospiraceae bacterium]|nr:ABC transporter ATP-binding protein [Lachnospiraceae bacterium]